MVSAKPWGFFGDSCCRWGDQYVSRPRYVLMSLAMFWFQIFYYVGLSLFTFSLRWAPWSGWNDGVVFCSLLQTSPFMNGWVGSKSMVFTIEPMGNTSEEIYNATLDMLLQQVYKARIDNYVSNFRKSSSFTISFSIFQLRHHFAQFYVK